MSSRCTTRCRAATDASELDSGVRQLLLSARRLLRAEYAELLILPVDPRERPLRSSLGPHGELLLEPTDMSAGRARRARCAPGRGGPVTMAQGPASRSALDPYLAERGLKDAILTTLEGENGLLGLLHRRRPQPTRCRPSAQEDEKLFRTFAGHAALLLENEQLEQSLAKLTELEAQAPPPGAPRRAHRACRTGASSTPASTRRSSAPRPTAREPVVLFIDLDGFKAINDDLGHAAGDELLVAFAERLRSNVRPEELPARLGGDEFAVLIESGGAEVAEDVAQRLVGAVRNPFSIHGRRLSVRLSIGIAPAEHRRRRRGAARERRPGHVRGQDRGLVELRRLLGAHARLGAGRGRSSAQALEDALERDQIAVHYQPIVDLRTGGDRRVRGARPLAARHAPTRSRRRTSSRPPRRAS